MLRIRGVSVALLLLLGAAACDRQPVGLVLLPVVSGTIDGHAFTVTGGTMFQARPDGPLYADASGGRVVFTEDPAGLGMSDPDLLQLRTQFALSDGGSLQVAAFGTAGAEFTSGLWVLLARDGAAINYDFVLGGTSFADSAFFPPPPIPSAELWVVTEFYADSVPGYPAGESGIAMWELEDLTPTFNEDVLRCDPGPATDPTPAPGDRVGYALQSAWVLAVEVVDQVVGPCM